MKKTPNKKWNVVYWLIFPFGFIGLFFSVGLVGQIDRHQIYISLIVFSIIIVGFTLLHSINLILRLIQAKSLFKAKWTTTIALILISLLIVSWTNNFRPAPKLKCEIDLTALINQIKTDLSADSVTIREVVIQEELYFPKLVGPRITVFNPSLNFEDSLSSVVEREKQAKLIGQEYGDAMYNACEMSGYNDIMIDFLTWDAKDRRWKIEYISHYYNSAYE